MRRFVPVLLTVALVSAAHAAPQAAPAQVTIKITDAAWSADTPATFTPVKDPATGRPNDLLALQQAAARAKITLAVTPGPTVTTTNGVAGALDTSTRLPFTATDAQGKKRTDYQTLENRVSVLPRVNADGTIVVQFTVTESKVTGPPTMPDGASPIMTQSFSTLLTFRNGQTKTIGSLDSTVHSARPDSTTHSARFVFATVTLVPPAKP